MFFIHTYALSLVHHDSHHWLILVQIQIQQNVCSDR